MTRAGHQDAEQGCPAPTVLAPARVRGYKPPMLSSLPLLSTILRAIARVLLGVSGLGLLLRLIRP